MKNQTMTETHEEGLPPVVLYDRYLLFATIALLGFGLLMVASTSIAVSEHLYKQPFHYLVRQACYLVLGLAMAMLIFHKITLDKWQKLGGTVLVISLILLVLVLVPKLGREVNGSMRWLGIGGFGLQVSEFAKLAVVIYLAGYLVRREQEVRTKVTGFLKPLFLLGIIAILLLREPDFGATSVIMATSLGMLFLAGVRLWQFAVLFSGVVAALATLAITSPYRMARLTTFLNPWVVQYDSGYQLTQSLIAFGRGGWLGVGLGESVQKLFYLPEAHTDFLFAVLTEELGLIGSLVVIALFIVVVTRALQIGRKAYLEGRHFAAYIAFGFGLEIAMQVMINIGVNTGVLPTKGLTLPFMSYGGSSLLMMCGVMAILLRIDHESRLAAFGMTAGRR
jgi:cell division protein FtsW